ncbi:MAG TPA: hemolysin family protein [Candidatus Eisenbacteria bacterium]|nr:hemolysin family protein [Candidatus Eisenbacteria bacterium]
MIPLLILLALLVSAVFSGAETVVLSAQRLRYGTAKKAEAEGGTAARLAADPSRLLATILVGNSLANVFAASLATLWVARRWGEPAVWIAVLILAPLTLLVSEILPKSLARAQADRIGERLLPPVAAAYAALRPWVGAVTGAASWLLRRTGLSRGPLAFRVTRQDLQILLSESDEIARLTPLQGRILRRVFDFAETPVGGVMTPRTRMIAIPLGTTVAAALTVMRDKHLSRLPAYREDLDQVVGVVHRLDLFRAPSGSLTVDGMVRPVFLVPESKQAAECLREMQARRQHMAIVLDEYGGTAGLVTHEDLVEELVGEIGDERARAEPAGTRRLDALTVAVPGSTRLEEMAENMGVNLPEGDYETVAGLLLDRMGHVPTPGEWIVCGGYRLEVLSADRRRIDQVAVKSQRVTRRAPRGESPRGESPS